jgi:hypothetical protein
MDADELETLEEALDDMYNGYMEEEELYARETLRRVLPRAGSSR